MTTPQVHGIFDPATWTVTYVVHQGVSTACAIIDSVLDCDPKSGRTKTTSADKVVDYVRTNQLKVEWILETHAHADHLTAAPYLKSQLGGRTAIGDHITAVQSMCLVTPPLVWHNRRSLHRDAHKARRHAGNARAHSSRRANQHPRR